MDYPLPSQATSADVARRKDEPSLLSWAQIAESKQMIVIVFQTVKFRAHSCIV